MPKQKKNEVDTYKKLKSVLNKPINKGKLSDRINTFELRVRLLKEAYTYIDGNRGTLRGAFKPYNLRDAMKAIQELSNSLDKELEALRSQMVKQQNFANQLIIKNDTGEYAGNRKFYVNFVNVGLGDCTLITTPKGKTIMLDCGSHALKDVTSVIPGYNPAANGPPKQIIGNSIRSKTFLNGNSIIDILVLSHTDADHHNQLKDILGTISGMKVNVVYFGGADTITKYSSSAYIKEIAGTTESDLKRVDLKELPDKDKNGNIVLVKQINGSSITATSGKPNELGDEFIDPTTGEIVLYYEDDDTSDFRLSVLASNTLGVWVGNNFIKNDAHTDLKASTEMKENSDEANRTSLVALAHCFGQQIIITGDATAVTERFMINNYSKQLATVQTLRIGHHGSPTSSSEAFVNALTAMERAVASTCGEKTKKYAFPKFHIMDLFRPKLLSDPPAPPHNIWSWKAEFQNQKVFPEFNQTKAHLFATGSNNSVHLSFEKSKSKPDPDTIPSLPPTL